MDIESWSQAAINKVGDKHFGLLLRVSAYLYSISFLISLESNKLSNVIISIFAFGIALTFISGRTDLFFNIFSKKFVIPFIIIQSILFASNIYFEYYSLNFNYYDTGSFSNPIANFINGFGFYNSELNINEFGDHFSPNLLLLSPIYLFFQDGVVLILVKFLSYILTYFLIYKYSKFKSLETEKIFFIMFMWSICLGVNNFMGFEFQPSNLVVPFVFLLFYLWESKKWTLFYLLLLFSCGFKENVPMVLISIGIFSILEEKRYVIGIGNILGGVILFFFITRFLQPKISGIENIHQVMFDPFCCFPEKLYFITTFLLSTGFLLFFYPRLLLVISPTLAVSLLSNRPGTHTLTYHYQDIPTALAFCMLIHVLHSRKNLLPEPIWKYLDYRTFAALAIGFSFFINTNSGNRFISMHKPTNETKDAIKAIGEFKKKLDPNSRIWAQTDLAFYLSSEHKIKCIMNVDDPIHDLENQYVVLCDFSPGRWPIENDYERLKISMREEVAKGVRAEHLGYYPLVIFELRTH